MNQNEVVKYYENYREEDRLSTNNARKIELVTTIKMLDALIEKKSAILDCASGTGVYAFYFAEQGHQVTATDITPRHVAYMREKLKHKPYYINTQVLDATDMSCFSDETFDIVLNMGAMYHLIDESQRMKCLTESLRVLKTGGILIMAYIPRLYLNQMIALHDTNYLDNNLLKQIKETGVLKHNDPKCFWTDTYYSSYEEMEKLYQEYSIEVLLHFAQDGLLPMLCNTADNWNEEQFKIWADYHLSVCKEKSIIGMSNHVIIAGRKK
ncbi:MAG: class I SAM-dependent methyltransferase [Oscillospiraceae bacterium]|nr:class I SAM-dependent methyltransferase [Oscillospiraceae bacterium]